MQYDLKAPEIVTLRQFADILGCKPSYITQLKQAGRLVLTDDGKKVMVRESQQRIRDTKDPAKLAAERRHAENRGHALTLTGKNAQRAAFAAADGTDDGNEGGDDAGDGENTQIAAENIDYQAAKARHEHYKAQRAELEYRKAAGELIPAEDAAAAAASAVTVLRGKLEAMPQTVCMQVRRAPTDEAGIALMAEYLESLLADLAGEMRKISK